MTNLMNEMNVIFPSYLPKPKFILKLLAAKNETLQDMRLAARATVSQVFSQKITQCRTTSYNLEDVHFCYRTTRSPSASFGHISAMNNAT
jgi:hypothetical protein